MVPSNELADWRRKMGVKEARLRELREAAADRTPDQRTDVVECGAGRGGAQTAATQTAAPGPLVSGNRKAGGDAAPVITAPREMYPPVVSRGRPSKERVERTLKALAPWEKCDPPISRRTWFRRKGKPDVEPSGTL
jgi:hypothetical protein